MEYNHNENLQVDQNIGEDKQEKDREEENSGNKESPANKEVTAHQQPEVQAPKDVRESAAGESAAEQQLAVEKEFAHSMSSSIQQGTAQHHSGSGDRNRPGHHKRTAEGRYRDTSSRPYQRSNEQRTNPKDRRPSPQQEPQQSSTGGIVARMQGKNLNDFPISELNLYARMLGLVGAGLMRKDDLINRIRHIEANPEFEIEVEGVLEKLPDGFGFLRSAQYDYISGPDDVYVSPSQIRRFSLRTGDTLTGVIRKPKEGEKYFALLKVTKVNFCEPIESQDRLAFDLLTPEHPHKKLNLEFDEKAISTRMMDIFTPIGKGQRGLIVAPPKVGKTLILKELAHAIIANHPEVYLIVLLVDERPEEVADMRKTIRGASAEVISSTFDESVERHVQVTEIVLEKAKRLAESGKDVVILLDSMTRLARAYNTNTPASGKVLTGGIDANALQLPKRFFGAARSTAEAGSLTIIATALIDTGSRMDEVIYEEFKGTGNMEMHMTRKLSNRRIYPAFDLLVSGTRRDDLLHTEEDLNRVWILQKFLATMNVIEGMEFLIDKMKKCKTNREFFEAINKQKVIPATKKEQL